ncbi:FAD-dependent monooxygenase [Deminuibacter soli]|uniref:FAD-binding domain-containing protein n=1 Tax=Deminuibacter soli TaxID=2291815 RepID=A0A3E1NGR5_9BACT|nr:FAD-dependent monooxygenase [Deminuibacter soli]RFM27145.1 hypothetical protein DXN05_16935 [Deminuibacter soli]
MRKNARGIPVNNFGDEWGGGVFIERICFEYLPDLGQWEQPERHDRHSFFLLEAGNVTMEIDFQQYHINAPSIIYMHPDQVHRIAAFKNIVVSAWAVTNDNLNAGYLKLLEDILPAAPMALNDRMFALLTEAVSLCIKFSEREKDLLYHSLLKDQINALTALVLSFYWEQRMPSGDRLSRSEFVAKAFKPVNILGNTIGIVKRMGLLDQIQLNALLMKSVEFKNAHDITERLDLTQKRQADSGETEYEIERDILLDMLYQLVKDDVAFVYGESITGLKEQGDQVEVNFKNGAPQTFDLVFGCDGIHSVVRKYWFGAEAAYSRFLQAYFSITIVNKLLIPEYTTQMYSEPGKTVMLNAYNGKTDICLAFFAEQEIAYDYRNEQQQRNIILDQFKNTGWRTAELLEEVQQSTTFYFDKLCQMKMPSWTKGRVALVGDAGYCASPAAGRGGSLAIDGAAALADAFQNCQGDYELAFAHYNHAFRPFIDEVQADVVNFGMEALIPRSQEAIDRRNKEGFGF